MAPRRGGRNKSVLFQCPISVESRGYGTDRDQRDPEQEGRRFALLLVPVLFEGAGGGQCAVAVNAAVRRRVGGGVGIVGIVKGLLGVDQQRERRDRARDQHVRPD